jgi:hypothetical protein
MFDPSRVRGNDPCTQRSRPSSSPAPASTTTAAFNSRNHRQHPARRRQGLDEAALNAAIALIDSLKPQNELQALLAVQIASVAFAADKMLRQSQQHLDEAHINVYGNYALKLFRVQLEMIETLDRHRRGNRQTVEVRHVHIHAGAQGVVGILNAERQEGGTEK